MDAIRKIEAALAAGPTDGPWGFNPNHSLHGAPTVCADGVLEQGVYIASCAIDSDGFGLRDAAYIAACNPAAIREVLQTLASKEAEIARLRAALEPFVDYPAETLTLDADEGFTMTVRGFHLHNAVAALQQPPKEPT